MSSTVSIRSNLSWQKQMKFESIADGNAVMMDAKRPIGASGAQTPKELVAAGLGGCTAMDVVALLKKYKQPLEKLDVEVAVETNTKGYPTVFTHALITFKASGEIDPKKLLEAVTLSQTKYCGVSAMLSKAHPIDYVVVLNGKEIGKGKSEFGESQ